MVTMGISWQFKLEFYVFLAFACGDGQMVLCKAVQANLCYIT